MKKIYILLVIAVCSSVAPNARGAKKVGDLIFREVDEKKALVYVIRDGALAGGLRTTFVYVDEQFTSTVDSGSYAAFYVEPGTHTFRIGDANAAKPFILRFDPGKEYFFLWRLGSILESLDSESGRQKASQVEDFVEPTENERRTGERAMERLRQQLFYAWSPEMVGLIDEFGERLSDVNPRTLEAIKGIVEQHRAAYGIPPGSLGEVVVVAELADLGASYSMQEGDINGARELLRAAVSGYGVAAERFEVLRQQERKKKWTKLISYAVVGAMAGTPGNVGGADVAASGTQQRMHLREAEDARKFGKEAERRLVCIEREKDSASVLRCIEES